MGNIDDDKLSKRKTKAAEI